MKLNTRVSSYCQPFLVNRDLLENFQTTEKEGDEKKASTPTKRKAFPSCFLIKRDSEPFQEIKEI